MLTGARAVAVTATPLGLFQTDRTGCGGAAPRYQGTIGWPIVANPPPLAMFGGGFPLIDTISFFPLSARPRSASAWHHLRGFHDLPMRPPYAIRNGLDVGGVLLAPVRCDRFST